MMWNWQQPDWPNFTWDANRLVLAEREFLIGGGILFGAFKHLAPDDQNYIAVEAMSTEALTTSEIEGEILDRASVQSSIQRQLGLKANERYVRPGERGIAEMMVDLYRSSAAPLTDDMLFNWHRLIMAGSRIADIGKYRTGEEVMQVVSSNLANPKVHFEAPPSRRVPSEMARFVDWFNRTGSDGPGRLPALARAGIAHLYFESIHPFVDGNGRIGRAIAEKSLADSLGQPTLTSLGATILSRRSDYYAALEAASKSNEITAWLVWFAGVAIESGRRTIALTEFFIDKTKMFDRLNGKLNARQEKALLRVFAEGPSGFRGGLSAGNYTSITGASAATTTRDLADLVEKGVLTRTGERRHVRYHLAVPLRPTKRVALTDAGELMET